jgi:prolyl-tRNA editing enzyme YbaK/EbsC (Cys-tRNA(Pro) deacylase)
MPIYIEQSILDLENIYINGGKRGLIVKINSSDLDKIIDFETVHVSI